MASRASRVESPATFVSRRARTCAAASARRSVRTAASTRSKKTQEAWATYGGKLPAGLMSFTWPYAASKLPSAMSARTCTCRAQWTASRIPRGAAQFVIASASACAVCVSPRDAVTRPLVYWKNQVHTVYPDSAHCLSPSSDSSRASDHLPRW